MSDARALVIENDPTDDIRRLGEWLTDAGLDLRCVQAATRARNCRRTWTATTRSSCSAATSTRTRTPTATRAHRGSRASESLLRKAVRNKVATLGVCLGGQLLAAAHGGVVERSPTGPEIGAKLVARRDAAEDDPLWRYVPFVPDVLQWHHDEITELPAGATLLAASTNYPHQAFRIGDRAWGLQFHIECDVDMIADWAADNDDVLADLGTDAATRSMAGCAAVMDDIEEVWQPFAARFAAVARGELDTTPTRVLPLLGH